MATHIRSKAFEPYNKKPHVKERLILIALLMLGTFLRVYRLREVPPGIHNDEIINAEITERLRAGASLAPFYEAGTGKRETLFYFLLLTGRALTNRVPYWYRLPSVLCSLLMIVLVYHLSRRRFGPWVALVTVGGLTVSFWPVYLGREALRSALVPLLGAGMTLALWRGLERSQNDTGAFAWFALAGLLLGALQYTYPAARVVPVVIGLFIVYLAIAHRARLRVHWRGFALLLISAALVAAPAGVYIATHWEQQQRIMELKGPLEALWAGDPTPVLSSTAQTLGMFVIRGDPQPHYNLPGRPVFEPVSGLLFLLGTLVALLNLGQAAHAYILLWTLVLMVPGMVTQPAPHFSRTAGVLMTTFVFPGLAVRWIVDRLSTRSFRWRIMLITALALLLVANLGLTWRDYFHRWPQVAGVRDFHHAGLAEAARYLDRSPDTAPIAACTPFLNEEHFFWRTDRQALPYLLNRHDLDVSWYSCPDSQLFPRGGETARYLFWEGLDFAPFVPSHWRGEAKTIATFQDGRLVRLDVAVPLERWLSAFEQPPASETTFGGVMAQAGYRVSPSHPAAGDALEVLTAWRVSGQPPRDLTVFLHLFASDGTLITQDDALTALSDTFRPGDIFVQRHTLELPTEISPGAYRLATGLYRREGTRLPLPASTDGVLTLGALEIDDDNN